MNAIFEAWTGVIGADFISLVYVAIIIHAAFSAIFDEFI